MSWYQKSISYTTSGRSSVDISKAIQQCVVEAGVSTGLVHVFLRHTSASLMLCENADPTVRVDLETLFSRMAPDADPEYRHDYEGDDDMAAHARSILTTNDISLPVERGRLGLGTWQGVFLWEHRYQPHHRTVLVTIHGE